MFDFLNLFRAAHLLQIALPIDFFLNRQLGFFKYLITVSRDELRREWPTQVVARIVTNVWLRSFPETARPSLRRIS